MNRAARGACAFVHAGVGAASLVNLQAQLFRSQQNAAARKDGTFDGNDKQSRRKAGLDVSEIYKRQNKGVEQRDLRCATSIALAAVSAYRLS